MKIIQYTSDVEKEVKFRLPGQESLIELIRRGTAIDDELQHWTQTLPECWKLEKLFKSHRPWSEESGAPRTIHVYKGIWASAEWNNYRAIRLHLLERLIELSNAIEESMNPYFEPLANEWKRKALEIAEEICASVPFALEKIDMNRNFKNASVGMALGGCSLLLALRMAVTCLHVPKKRRSGMIEKLGYVSNSMRISQAASIEKGGKICFQCEKSQSRFGGPIDLRDLRAAAASPASTNASE